MYELYNVNNNPVSILEKKYYNEFEKFLYEQQNNPLNVRNKDWFHAISVEYKNKTKYLDWFIIKKNDSIIAISSIQQFSKYEFRFLTRYTLANEFRRPILHNNEKYYSPSVAFSLFQYKYMKDNYDTNEMSFIITMEERRSALHRVVNKLNLFFEKKWSLSNEMLLTCGDEKSSRCWQNYCFINNDVKNFKKMDIETWKILFQ